MSLRVVALKTSVRSTSLKESCVAINMVDLDLCIIALAVEEEQEVTNKTERKRKRKFWVHDLWKKRREVGEFETFCKNLNQYPDLYYDYYKMTYIQFETLVNILKPHLKRHETNFRIPVSVEERLSICLRFLTTAISFQALSHSYRLGHSTVHTIVHETCGAIWKYLQPHVMPKPTPQLWTRIEEEFRTIWNFPNCIGAIDGKHVNIRAPWNSGSLFYNYKKFFSTVLLAITDAKYRFIVVDIGSYGRNSDSGILSSSKLGRKLQNKTLGIPPNKCLPGTREELPHVFVGDEGFPLSEHLMRPYPSNQLTGDNEKKKINYRLSRARRIVESSFGILQQKFEVFQKRIRMQPRYVDIMILACTCLHNYIRNHEIENDFGDQLENVSAATNSILQIVDEQENDDLQNNNSGIIVRNKFKSFFNSPNGAITWQNERLDFVR